MLIARVCCGAAELGKDALGSWRLESYLCQAQVQLSLRHLCLSCGFQESLKLLRACTICVRA